MSKLRVRAGGTTLEIALDATPTAAALLKSVPFESIAQTWGEEVYFEAPVSISLEAGAQQTVDPGTVCYWVEGSSIALPYGRTPISGKDGKPKLVTACNVLGRIVGDPKMLAKVKSGDRIHVEAG